MSARCLVSRLVFAVGLLMVFWCAPALAVATHPFLSSFGSFSDIQGVAVDQSTGDVYVLDTGVGEGSLFKFDAAGKPLKFTGLPGEPSSITGLHGAGDSENELAVDSSTGPAKGDIYVAVSTSNGEQIDVIAPDGESLGALTKSTAPWGETCGVSVDPSGNVYVGVYQGYVDKFTPTANPVTNSDYVSSIVGAEEPCNLAVDTDGNVFATRYGGGPVERYEASLFGQLSASGSIVDTVGSTLAVDPADNHVYVDSGGEVSEFGANGEPFQAPLTVFGHPGTKSFGIAVNETSGYIYVSDGNGKISVYGPVEILPDTSIQAATALTGENATLNGTVNPEGQDVSSCRFEYGAGEEGFTESSGCSPMPGSGNVPVAVSAVIAGLSPGTDYHYRLSASNANGSVLSPEGSFTTKGPRVVEESDSNIGSSSATVTVLIEPHGEPTTLQVEYGPTTEYGSRTSTVSVGSASIPVREIISLNELQSETLYHFRVLASGDSATARGQDMSFTTFPAATLGLPDNRGYEKVSPNANADGNVIPPATSGLASAAGLSTSRPMMAAANGTAVTYLGGPSESGGTGNEGGDDGNQYLSRRSSNGTWTSVNIESSSGEHRETPVYRAFTKDLTAGFMTSNGSEPLTQDAPGQYYAVLYQRILSPIGEFEPLFTTKPPDRSAEEFTAAEIPTYTGQTGYNQPAPAYAGSSADLSRSLFMVNDALTAGAVDGGAEENNLYDSHNGELTLVNVLPDGTTEPNATFGGPTLPNEYAGADAPSFSHVISEDGKRIFWTDLNTGDLYLREDERSTIQVDAAVGGGGTFWTATPDGSEALFTKNGDIYEYDVADDQTTDLTPGGEVQGIVGTSEDLSYVYFVADAALAPGAEHQACIPGDAKTSCNLYVLHTGEPVKLIATLSATDNESAPQSTHFEKDGDWQPGMNNKEAEVTPDGTHLIFTSVRPLTGYDSHNDEEVFTYDYASSQVLCVSCKQSGEPPAYQTTSAFLPVSHVNTYMHRWMSSDGTKVFFDSQDALVPQDTDGVMDVYEWEEDGAGDCERTQGCIYLLSAGSSPESSWLLDASESGDDVFIETRSQLTPEDQNETIDVYDVRADAPQRPTEPQCTGTGCQGIALAPPVFSTPSSVTYNGVGNFAPTVKVTGKANKPKKTSKTTSKKKSAKKRTKPKKKREGRARKAKKPAPRSAKSNGRNK